MFSFLASCRRIANKFAADEMTVYAAQASFFIILSFFPFVMVLLTVIQLIPSINQADLQRTILALTPDVIDSLVFNIIQDIYTDSPQTVLSITAIVALWTSSKGMLSIERGFNRVFGNNVRRGYVASRIMSSFYTIIFLAVCVMTLGLLVFGGVLERFITLHFPFIAAVTSYIITFRALFSLSVLVLFFTGLYTYLPHEKLTPRSQLPGAVFTTVCWIGSSQLFSIYFNHFSNFSYMYGSLTSMVLVMLWLYLCICILFLGAEINESLMQQ